MRQAVGGFNNLYSHVSGLTPLIDQLITTERIQCMKTNNQQPKE